METKDDAVAMDYKDIEKFIQEKKMNDVTLVPIYQDLSDKEHTLEERFIIKVYSHLKNEIKKFVKTEKKKDGDHFSKDKCFRFIYKDPDNTDDHAYCFIFGCSGGKPYIITQKTTQDTKVLATMYNDTDVKFEKLFGEPFLWNSIKDKKSCAFTGLTMLKDLKADHIKNIVNNEQNSKILDKDKFKIISYKTIIPASKDVIPDSMMYVSQNANGIETYRKNIYDILEKFKHIQNTNGVKYNTYAQKKIKEFKGLK